LNRALLATMIKRLSITKFHRRSWTGSWKTTSAGSASSPRRGRSQVWGPAISQQSSRAVTTLSMTRSALGSAASYPDLARVTIRRSSTSSAWLVEASRWVTQSRLSQRKSTFRELLSSWRSKSRAPGLGGLLQTIYYLLSMQMGSISRAEVGSIPMATSKSVLHG